MGKEGVVGGGGGASRARRHDTTMASSDIDNRMAEAMVNRRNPNSVGCEML